MKVSFLNKLRSGHFWGGGNQFLNILKKELNELDSYTVNLGDADVVLSNSYQDLIKVIILKIKRPKLTIIFRLGPIFYYHRGWVWKLMDSLLIKASNYISDGVVFQSNWSLEEAIKLGFDKNKKHTVIYNCVDSTSFNSSAKKSFDRNCVRLITTSWSDNKNKGGDFLSFLDKKLEWDKFAMSFVGEVKSNFLHIKKYPRLSGPEMADLLKNSDIFLAPFRYEACSNSVLESLACGLPVVALDSGANGELIKSGGELFKDEQDLVSIIKKVVDNYDSYKSNITVVPSKKVVLQYLNFFDSCNIRAKQPSFFGLLVFLFKTILIFFVVKLVTKFFY